MMKMKFVKRMSALLLTVILTAAFIPAGVLAGETAVGSEEEQEGVGYTDSSPAETDPEGRRQDGNTGETGECAVQNNDSEGNSYPESGGSTDDLKDSSDVDAVGEPSDGPSGISGNTDSSEQVQQVVLKDDGTGIRIQGDASALPAVGTLHVTKVENGEVWELLNQYFSLIAEQLAVYDIRIFSLPDMSLTEPGAAVQISIPLPEGYDAGRAVLYYTDGKNMPVAVDAQVTDGSLVFESDHVGIFIIAEKKDDSGTQTDLPSYLEPTQKTEKLELLKSSLPGSISRTDSYGSYTSPQTGDSANFVVWIVVLAAAVAAVVVVVILKKRK